MKDIQSIFYLLNDIYIRGYTKEIKVSIIINNFEKHYEIEINSPEIISNKNKSEIEEKNLIKNIFEEKNIKEVKLIISKLKTIKEDLIKSQKEGYIEYEYIRYMFGRHFNSLYNYLHKRDDKNFVFQLLQYISNNQLIENIIDYKWKEKEEDEFKNIIYNFNEFIRQNMENNKLNLEKIYSKAKIIFNDFKGFYLYSCVGKPENQIFQLYKYLTGNTPFSQNILLCHMETSKEEIESFLYRAVFCNYNSCFMIGGIESLEFEQKNYLIELLNNIINEFGNKIKSCLIVLSNNKNTDIYKSIDAIKYKKYFKSSISDETKNCFLDKKDNIKIFSSNKSGVGKSTEIIKSINKSEYKYFPLGGYFSRDNIFNRLKNLSLKENSSLHLDLYDTDEIDLMTDFLFEILILKSYRKNEDFFILPKNINIIIEIPNCFINYKAKFPILNLVPKNFTEELFIEKLSPLNLDDNIQIVCNYLKLRKEKKIDNTDIIFQDTPEDLYKRKIKKKNGKKLIEKEYISKLFIPAKKLSQEECQDLIFEVFKENKDDFPSYYQIKAFIDVLAGQLKIFNKSYILNAEDLINENYKVVRSYTLEGFINMTKYTTKASYQKLLEEQTKTHDILFGEYDEQKDIEEGVNKLTNFAKNEISFDKLDSTLVFFHEGDGVMFKIIMNKPKDNDEYKAFIELLNAQNQGKTTKKRITELTDYKSLKTQEDFYFVLKDILNIDNPINEEEKKKIKEKKEKEEKEEKEKRKDKKEKDKKNEEKKEELLSIEEIAKNYVFTYDNFIKIILILIRIKANVPVIMMGETGCGKTSLIKKLSELLNNGNSNKMKIINFHAGVTDNDIIKKIEKYDNEAKKLEEGKNMWIFLDEINTCKSMGLISELMCKRSYQGKAISKNIVFIAACNPYRQAKKINDEEIGLNINLAFKELEKISAKDRKKLEKENNRTKLVYTVNPLPYSLLNYVFNFGSLKEEDEHKYIENMLEKPFNDIYLNNDYKDEIKIKKNEVKEKDENKIEKNELKEKD